MLSLLQYNIITILLLQYQSYNLISAGDYVFARQHGTPSCSGFFWIKRKAGSHEAFDSKTGFLIRMRLAIPLGDLQ